MKRKIEYKLPNNTKEIRVNIKNDDTSIIIFDFEKWIGAGIKLDKDVAISLASKILNTYNRDFVFSDKINQSLKNIEKAVNNTYSMMVEDNRQLWDDELLDLKMEIDEEIRKIRG